MDIAHIFKSKTRKEIFRLYFTNPDKEYYLRELERLINMPVSMIRKELIQLQKEGIFESSKKANLVYYKVNKSYPLFEELKSIVFKTTGVVGLLKDALVKIKGIELAFIYGSFARGKESASSDIDLFIIGNTNEIVLIREINTIEKILKREINYTLYSKEEFQNKKRSQDSFITDIIKNQKILLVGGENDI